MRILIPANLLEANGGLERTQLTNCSVLAKRGHVLDLVYVEDGSFSDDWRDITSTMTKVSTTLPRRAHPIRSALDIGSAIRHARGLKPDVIYVYRYWDLPFAVAVAARRQAVVAYHLCLPPPEPVPRWLRSILARVDTTISVSSHTLGLWKGTGLRTDGATVALTSVDLDRYAPADDATRAGTRSHYELEPSDFVVLYAGRIDPEKGIDVLIEAFRRLSDTVPRCHLVILGSTTSGAGTQAAANYMDSLRQRAEGLAVTWLPRRHDVVPLLQMADVAVVPSRWPEPLSRSIIEALACGVPVLATRVGGSPEILTGWMSEFLIPPEDDCTLAERLGSLGSWRSEDPHLGARCRKAAETWLSLDDEVDAIEGAMLDAMRTQ